MLYVSEDKAEVVRETTQAVFWQIVLPEQECGQCLVLLVH